MDEPHGNVGTTGTRVKCVKTGWFMEEQNLQAEEIQQAQAQPEKTFSQDEVNSLIGRTKAEAKERERRRAEQEYLEKLRAVEQQQEQQKQQEVADDSYASDEGSISQIKQQVVEELRAEEQKKQRQAQLQQIVDGFTQTVNKGRDSYGEEAWTEATKAFNPAAFPELVYYIQRLPNGHDVLKEIAENPNQLVTLNSLAKLPDDAMIDREINRLAESVKQRQEKVLQEKENNVQAPLDSLQPSRVSGSNGDMSVGELRSQPWLRG
jgi:hypothetical protein